MQCSLFVYAELPLHKISLFAYDYFHITNSIEGEVSSSLDLFDEFFLHRDILFHELLLVVVVLEQQLDGLLNFLDLHAFHHGCGLRFRLK